MTPLERDVPSRRHARRRLAMLGRAASLGGVALAMLAPGAHAETRDAGDAGDAPNQARLGERLRARTAGALDRPVRAATPQAERVLGAFQRQAADFQFTNQGDAYALGDVGANSAPSVADLDGDGDLDVLSGEFQGGLVYFENTGTATAPAFTRDASATPFGLGDVGYYSTPSVADLDGDGDLDVLAGTYDGIFVYFENTGTATAPAFTRDASPAPFGLGDLGDRSSPSVADLDGDGDLDVLSGEATGGFVVFENTGTATAPAFTNQGDVYGLGDIGERSAPSVADLDGDGDLDVLAGERYGGFVVFENTGTATAPAFTRDASATPFGLGDLGFASSPSVADLDGDGDLDVLSGERYGGFVVFENAPPPPGPVFGPAQTNPFGLGDIGDRSKPSVADLDGDGDLDVLSGELNPFGNGSFFYFENTGTATAPAFGPAQTNPFGLTNFSQALAPSMADLDGDGDLDVLSGDLYGSFVYFENTGTATTPAFGPAQPNPFGLTNLQFRSKPSVADLDGDGDLDVLSGENYGDFYYFENTGTATAPAFGPAHTNPFGLTAAGGRSRPSVADLDGDGDLDVLSGEFYGTFVYYENTGTATAPAFTNQGDALGLGDIGDRSSPSVADLDGDGDLDVLSGEWRGRFFYFENTGNARGTKTALVTGDEGWRMLSAPSDVATVDALLGFTHTQGYPGADFTGGEPTVYLYDESLPGDEDLGYRTPTSQSEALPLGRGAFAYLYADDDLSQPDEQGGFPKTLAVTGETPQHTFGWGADGPGLLTFTDSGAPDDDGWNLLGNPFGSWFDWDAVELTNVNAPVYVYDDAIANYRTYSAGAGNLAGGVVGPFQGFWVQASAASPAVTARAEVSNGGPLYRQAAPLVVALSLRPEDDARAERSETVVVFGTAGADPGRDGLDALALAPPVADYLQLATLVPDGLGLSVDHRPGLNGTAELPLSVQAAGALVGQRLVLSWPAFDAGSLPAGTTARLRDAETGAEVDLATATEYAFTVDGTARQLTEADVLAVPAPTVLRGGSDGARVTGRFTLVVSNAATDSESGATEVALTEAFPNPVRQRAVLRLSVPTAQRVRATVYDALGRTVQIAFDGDVASSAEIAVDASQFAAGAYVVRVQGASFTQSRRLTVVR